MGVWASFRASVEVYRQVAAPEYPHNLQARPSIKSLRDPHLGIILLSLPTCCTSPHTPVTTMKPTLTILLLVSSLTLAEKTDSSSKANSRLLPFFGNIKFPFGFFGLPSPPGFHALPSPPGFPVLPTFPGFGGNKGFFPFFPFFGGSYPSIFPVFGGQHGGFPGLSDSPGSAQVSGGYPGVYQGLGLNDKPLIQVGTGNTKPAIG
nr:collagen alpha-1(XXVII) chain-like [Cherax quadricarinatus]